MVETLLGGLVGGALRLAPELFKVVDRRNERAHELALQNVQLEFEKARGAQKMAELGAAADASLIDAYKAAIEAQGRPSGVPWADALSSAIRPGLTLSFFALFAATKVAAWHAGASFIELWGPEDRALWSSICSFWFVSRVYDRAR